VLTAIAAMAATAVTSTAPFDPNLSNPPQVSMRFFLRSFREGDDYTLIIKDIVLQASCRLLISTASKKPPARGTRKSITGRSLKSNPSNR
jgi:hypothetical protein